MAFTTASPKASLSFGRGGYNKDDDDDEKKRCINYGRGGYNKDGTSSNDDEDRCGPGDDDEEDVRGGYN